MSSFPGPGFKLAASKGVGSGPGASYVQAELQAAFADLRSGQAQASSARLDRLIRQYPRRADLQRAKGIVSFQLGDLPEAHRWLLSGLQSEPDHLDTLIWISTVCLRLGRLQEAESHARKLVRLQPNQLASQLLIGNILFALERYSEALPHVMQAFELDPASAEAVSLQRRISNKIGREG